MRTGEGYGRPRRTGAALLVQVLLSLALLGILLPGLLDLLGAGDRDLASSAGLARAVEAAQIVLEQVTDERFLMAHVGQQIQVPDEAEPGIEVSREFVLRWYGRVRVRVDVVPRQSNPLSGKDETDLLEIRVEACWREQERDRSYRLVTRRAIRTEVEP